MGIRVQETAVKDIDHLGQATRQTWLIEVSLDVITDEVGHFAKDCRKCQQPKEKRKVYQRKESINSK